VSEQARDLSRPAEVRRARADELLRAHGDLLDRDPAGNLVVRDELIGFGVTSYARAGIQAAGFVIRRQEPLSGLDAAVIALAAPHGYSTRRALRLLRAIDPDGAYDFNHIYFDSGAVAGVASTNSESRGGAKDGAESTRRVGLIDGGVQSAHSALKSVRLVTHGCNGAVVPSSHGTASASRLLDGLSSGGNAASGFELFVADVYCGAPAGGSVEMVTDAIAWLVEQKVPVINVSLVGPSNVVLQRAIELAIARGHLIVAAVGNDGPAAPPLYPAAFPGVVAVTGVDRTDKVLPEAGRGGFVAFAAPGADIDAANLPEGFVSVRGTSFAAPVVAGRLALLLDRADKTAAEHAVRLLAASARDLGAPGRDPIYGNGCVGCGEGLAPSTAARVP
jgi:subtilisin family serine protease